MRTYATFVLLAFLFILLQSCGDTPSTDDSVVAAEPTEVPTPSEETIPSAPDPSSDFAEAEADAEGGLSEIRQQYSQIRQALEAGDLREDVSEFECEIGNGSLTRYYRGQDLVMLEYQRGEEHHWETKRVYLENGDPFFVFKQEGSWSFGGPFNEENPNTIDKIQEDRYYLDSGALIHHLTKSYEVKSWEEEVTSDEVPNTVVEVAEGAVYPEVEELEGMMTGVAGC